MLLFPQSYHNIGVAELTTVIDQLMPSTILQPIPQIAASDVPLIYLYARICLQGSIKTGRQNAKDVPYKDLQSIPFPVY